MNEEMCCGLADIHRCSHFLLKVSVKIIGSFDQCHLKNYNKLIKFLEKTLNVAIKIYKIKQNIIYLFKISFKYFY